jgi:hypothetical protein
VGDFSVYIPRNPPHDHFTASKLKSAWEFFGDLLLKSHPESVTFQFSENSDPMLISFTTSSIDNAAAVMLASGLPGRHNPARLKTRGAVGALVEECMR